MSWEPPFSTGTDGAEPTGLRRLLRQPGARRNLTIAAGVAGAALFLLPRGSVPDRLTPRTFDAGAVSTSPGVEVPEPAGQPDALLGTPAPTEMPATSPTPTRAGSAQHESLYTIYLYKLSGLAPDASPGTYLDIWVTWKPPVTERAKVQLLLQDVQLARIETGFEQGPVADLLVDERDIPDLIYGERFGSFNVVARPG